ncbi:MAG: DUF134 domain-containing protein [Cyclobacteriaceae bacterium]|nr:DUF134 domain-containing protein [Cyclobacteriaceae bacterium]
MPRPKRNRVISNPPIMEGFRPFGIPEANLDPLILLYEEYESIRLADYLLLTQEQAAKEMHVSRSTYTRIYENARRTIAQAFVEGKAIFIEGGNFHTNDFWYRCGSCMKLVISEAEAHSCPYCRGIDLRRLNQKKEFKKEDNSGYCICVNCDTRLPHVPGVPCRDSDCPTCGTKMMREGSYHHKLYITKKGESNHENSSPHTGQPG